MFQTGIRRRRAAQAATCTCHIILHHVTIHDVQGMALGAGHGSGGPSSPIGHFACLGEPSMPSYLTGCQQTSRIPEASCTWQSRQANRTACAADHPDAEVSVPDLACMAAPFRPACEWSYCSLAVQGLVSNGLVHHCTAASGVLAWTISSCHLLRRFTSPCKACKFTKQEVAGQAQTLHTVRCHDCKCKGDASHHPVFTVEGVLAGPSGGWQRAARQDIACAASGEASKWEGGACSLQSCAALRGPLCLSCTQL